MMSNERLPADAEMHSTHCCVVGGGPAGLVLSLLLARQEVPVTLLEAHHDFDRDFRGDTVHPSTLELLDQLGLAERLHALPHRKMHELAVSVEGHRRTIADFRRIPCKFPYIMLMPQAAFLEFLAQEAAKYPSFRLVLGANVSRLVEEEGRVVGVGYQDHDSRWHEVRGALTVGTDGRFSRVRHLAGFEPIKTSPPMDVLWFRLPRRPEDDATGMGALANIGRHHMVVLLERPDQQWQIGYVIFKGTYGDLKRAGIESVRQGLIEVMPMFADRASLLTDFRDITMLSVEVSHIPVWHKPGLLLLGDAAHVMSPVGGVGIQYAVQDAVEAANQLTAPLRREQVEAHELAAIQKRREPSARRAQWLQGYLQRNIVAQALQSNRPFQFPLAMRILLSLPGLRNVPAKIIGWGIRPSYLQEAPPKG